MMSFPTDGGNSFPSVCVMVGAMLFPLFVGAAFPKEFKKPGLVFGE